MGEITGLLQHPADLYCTDSRRQCAGLDAQQRGGPIYPGNSPVRRFQGTDNVFPLQPLHLLVRVNPRRSLWRVRSSRALRWFAEVINETRGWPSDADLEAFYSAGYNPQSVLEVILGTSLKVLSNYTNHVAQTPLDQAFASNAWTASQAVDA